MNDTKTEERISADDLAYLQTVQRQLESAQAIHNSFMHHLANRHRLNIGDIVDTITGIIKRGIKE